MSQYLVKILHKFLSKLFPSVSSSQKNVRMNDSLFVFKLQTLSYYILLLFIQWLFISEWTKVDRGKPFVSKLVCFDADNHVLLARRIVEKNQWIVWVILVSISTTCCHVSEWKPMFRHCSKHFICSGITTIYNILDATNITLY